MYWPEEARCAIFDMDGTILDSMGLWKEIDIRFLEKRGLTYTPDYGEVMKTIGFREGALYSIERFHLSDTPESIIQEWNAMAEEAYQHHLPLKPGAKEYLTALKKKGIPIALATVSPPQFYRPALTAGQVMTLFDVLADASIVGGKKDGPALYLHVAQQLGTSPAHCLVFEDTLHALRGALEGGFLTCAVYDPSSDAQWQQMCREAQFMLEDFTKGPQRCGQASEFEHNT